MVDGARNVEASRHIKNKTVGMFGMERQKIL
jgi:hypothetical protein